MFMSVCCSILEIYFADFEPVPSSVCYLQWETKRFVFFSEAILVLFTPARCQFVRLLLVPYGTCHT